MKGTHIWKSYSKQQRTVALSSAEAELQAMVAASAETLRIIALFKDMGCDAGGEIYSDSSATLGIAQRQGIGKLRHIRTQALWVQEARVEGRLKYAKVLGSRNTADALTEYMASPLLDQHLQTVGLECRGGRAESAPELNAVMPYTVCELFKKVRFSGKIEFRKIPSTGMAKSVKGARARRAQWQRGSKVQQDDGYNMQEVNIVNSEGEIGGRRSE